MNYALIVKNIVIYTDGKRNFEFKYFISKATISKEKLFKVFFKSLIFEESARIYIYRVVIHSKYLLRILFQ